MFTLCAIQSFAAGDSNMNTGGTGLGGAINSSFSWSPQDYGVRITVVDANSGTAVGPTFDWVKSQSTGLSTSYSFGNRYKMLYKSGAGLSLYGGYSFSDIDSSMPTMVAGTGRTSLSAIESHFCDEAVLSKISATSGLSYSTLSNGSYKVMLEPTVYPRVSGMKICFTATEAALYMKKNAQFTYYLYDLVKKNLPLSLFLRRADIGIPAYGGGTAYFNPDQIISTMGVGLISFKDGKPTMGGGGSDPTGSGAANGSNTIKEWQLAASFSQSFALSNGSTFEGTMPAIELCDGWKEGTTHVHDAGCNISYSYDDKGNLVPTDWGFPVCGKTTEKVPCDLKHIQSYTIDSVSVSSGTFTNRFTSGTSGWKVVRNTATDGTSASTWSFLNTMADFTGTNGGLFKDQLNKFTWVSHRFGLGQSQLALAQYMNASSANQAYLSLGSSTFGSVPSAYVGTVGSVTGGSYSFGLDFGGEEVLGATAHLTLTYCDKTTGPLDVSGYVTKSSLSETVVVEPTYAASAHSSGTPSATEETSIKGGNAGSSQTLKVPSSTLTFNPTYKMYYASAPGGQANKIVWMLAQGQRTYKANDVLKVSADRGAINVIAPWSRDKEDTENATDPVIKSGMAYRAGTAESPLINVDVFFSGVDPSINPQMAAENSSAASQMVSALNNTTSDLAGEQGFRFFSNLSGASSAQVDSSLKVSLWDSETSKTTLESTRSISSGTTVCEYYYLDSDSTTTMQHGNIVVNGITFKCAGRLNEGSVIDNLTGAYSAFNPLIEYSQGLGNTLWYNEEYEGIVVFHIRNQVAASSVTSEYVQVHSKTSDWKTKLNAGATQLLLNGQDSLKIFEEDKTYGVGLSSHVNAQTIKGLSFKAFDTIITPYTFGVRGSVYDLQ